ncbi:hypothetical protein C9I28_26805 [Pseudoduganella armeniaca]|uniref:Uncharacterized protein n=1 Tax=Pseudoduganella armeniaca TaxID=2072590 RepID=A0A2R4CGV8_9BURK|nr:hypothetical protein C9I28_26805 [Pseudoduganella armeniaca]
MQQGVAFLGFPDFLLATGAVEGQARAAWDQAADDDVFLQVGQTVALSPIAASARWLSLA